MREVICWVLEDEDIGVDAAALRVAYGERAAPILTITADGFAADKARRVGAVGFLRKPCDVDDLVTAVRRALDGVGDGR